LAAIAKLRNATNILRSLAVQRLTGQEDNKPIPSAFNNKVFSRKRLNSIFRKNEEHFDRKGDRTESNRRRGSITIRESMISAYGIKTNFSSTFKGDVSANEFQREKLSILSSTIEPPVSAFTWGDSTSSASSHVQPMYLRQRWKKLSDFHILVSSCYAIVQTLAFGANDRPGASHVYNCFQGNFPPSIEHDWLRSKITLLEIVQQAYRLAVKLALDKFSETDESFFNSAEEAVSVIQQMRQDWYVGPAGSKRLVHHFHGFSFSILIFILPQMEEKYIQQPWKFIYS